MTGRIDPDTGEVLETEAIIPAQAQAVTLFATDDPEAVLAKAVNIAGALKGTLVKAGLISNIQGKEFPQVEAWTTLGAMTGVFAVATEQYRIPDDEGGGYRVYVEARKNGVVIGGAWGECSRNERSWSKRDGYALLGMAETRATSRALRKPLGWIMKLAGVEATSAEEMEGQEPLSRAAQAAKAGPQAQGGAVPTPGPPKPVNAKPEPAVDSKGRPQLAEGDAYHECPSCHKETVRINPNTGDAYCWKKIGGCGAPFTKKLWDVVSVPGPSSLDPPPPTFEKPNPKFPDEKEADSVLDLTGGEDLPF